MLGTLNAACKYNKGPVCNEFLTYRFFLGGKIYLYTHTYI